MRELDWEQFKTELDGRGANLQMGESALRYELKFFDGPEEFRCFIYKDTTGLQLDETANTDAKTDFEANYKSDSNKTIRPVDDYGKPYSRAESRPLDMTTYFTSRADNGEVGNGDRFLFDFNNTDNDITSTRTGFKQKAIEFSFIDEVRVKEGTIYWENMPYTSCMELCLMVPDQGFYKKNDGTIAQNTTGSNLVIDKFVNESPMMGDCPMGDELNTEAASAEVPAGTIFCLVCSVPDSVTNTDNCHAAVQMELYRRRTVVLV